MKIKFWGCRGSLPTPEPYAMRYGGNSTCLEIRLSDGTLLIVDAGSGIRKLGKALMADPQSPKEMYLFLTHSHWDHLMGFPFFVPAFIKGNTIHVRGGGRAKRLLERNLEKQMEAPFFPVDFGATKARFDFTSGKPSGQRIGSASLLPIPLSHPNGGWGFRIEDDGKSFVFLTDNELGFVHQGGLSNSDYVTACARADLAVHDAQYTEAEYKKKRTWGHSTFIQALRLGISSRAKSIGFFHHDPERTDEQIDELVAKAQTMAADENRSLDCFGVREGQVIELN